MLNITFYGAIRVDCPLLDAPQNALASLLSYGHNHIVHQPIAALICQQFAVQAKPDYPLAALANGHAASQSSQQKAAYYLQADPVHLSLQRDCFVLSDPSALSITDTEMQTLCDVLNQHFLQDGLVFELTPKHQLLLRLATAPQIKTSLPDTVVGKNVFAFLPQGANAMQWNKIINEIQMLLHEHPINQQREALGLPAINSLWVSGGGVLPSVVKTHFTQVDTNMPYVQRLAQLADVALCDSASALKSHELNKKVSLLIALDSMDASHTSAYSTYFDDLLKQVKKGATVQLNLAFEEIVLSCDITPRHLKMRMVKQWFLRCINQNKSARQTLQMHFQAQAKHIAAV